MPAVIPRYKPSGIPICSTGCPYYELRPMSDGWRMGQCSHPDADSEAQPVCAPAVISLVKDSEEATLIADAHADQEAGEDDWVEEE